MIQFCFSCVFFVYIKIISYSTETSFSFPSCRDKLTEEVKHPIHIFLLGLHTTLRNSGWSMILFTRQHEKQRNVTIESLISAGYGGWSTLIMRSDHELRMESWEYISKRRVALHYQGFRITSVISSQMDALTGPCLGKQNFKFSNPTYYQIAQSITGFWYMLYQCSMSLFMVYNIQLMQFLQFFVYMVICLNE